MSSSITAASQSGQDRSSRSGGVSFPAPADARGASPSLPGAAVCHDDPARRVPLDEETAEQAARFIQGGAGDHHSIYQFLSSILPCPPRDAFLASLEDPFYEPTNRLLIKLGDRILAHVHLADRTLCLGDLRVPMTSVSGLATLAQCRGQGFAHRLMHAAEQQMLDSQTVVGLLRTGVPHFFRPQGWAACGRHSHSRARTRDVLAQLVDSADGPESGEMPIRPWRQVELPALMRLYEDRCRRGYGFIERSEAYWRWLISRKAFDQIYVAIHGPDRMELDDHSSPIVGYAFMRDDEIVELVASPDHPLAGPRLLARACGEAMERDQNSVCLHAPPGDPLYRLFQQAGGTQVCQEAWQGEVLMARVLEPAKLLRLLCPVLHERAQERDLPRPVELGFSVHGAKYRLMLTRRSVKVAAPRLGRSYLTMNDADFTRLLLGHLDIDEAVQAGRLQASTRVAQEAASILFPRLPLWRPPLDEVVM